MDYIREVVFWIITILNITGIVAVGSADRFKGKGLLQGFLVLSLAGSALPLLFMLLMRAGVASAWPLRLTPTLFLVCDVLRIGAWGLLLAFIFRLRSATAATSMSGGVAPAATELPAGLPSTSSIWSFRGRIGRGMFWAVFLSLLGVAIVVNVLVAGLASADAQAVAIPLAIAWTVVAVWLGVANQVKRWHDLGRSGWMVALNFTIIGLPVILVVLGCVQGTPSANRFGPSPLGVPSSSPSPIPSVTIG